MMKKLPDGQTISSERQEPTFYAMIPKMALLDLTPYELALYAAYKQTASDHGVCFKSNATLAKETHMSVSKLKEARKALEQKGFIRVSYTEDDAGIVNTPPDVKIVDIWTENHRRFASKGGHQKTTPRSPKNHPPVTTRPQRRTKEEESLKNIPAVAGIHSEQPENTSSEPIDLDEWFTPFTPDSAKNTQKRMKEAVFSVWGYPVGSALNTMIEQMLRGVSTRKTHEPFNLPKGEVSPEDVESWHDWYMASGVQSSDKVLPESPVKIQGSILKWIAAGKPTGKAATHRQTFQPAPAAPDPTDTDRARIREQLEAARQQIGSEL